MKARLYNEQENYDFRNRNGARYGYGYGQGKDGQKSKYKGLFGKLFGKKKS